jgi:hypothetical protein
MKMKKSVGKVFLLSAATCVCADMDVSALVTVPMGDRPDANHAWAVHDRHRPEPVKVEVPDSGVPSDAMMLFDGTLDSIARNWCDENGNPTKWTVEDGCFVSRPGAGGAFTRMLFGDCQLHVEFRIPDPPGEGRGNSGVILQSRYEVQVIDSHTLIPPEDPGERAWAHGDYADGQAGAIYGQHPPLVNPSRAPGRWQSYDIVFHPPLEVDGKIVDPGSITVFMNGVLVQDSWPLEGRCKWRYRPDPDDRVAEGPLRLQDHGNPVAYRNIWIRRLPSRFADTTGGGPGTDPAAVAKLRGETSSAVLSWAKTLADQEKRLMALAEAWAYCPAPGTRSLLDVAARDWMKAVDAGHVPDPYMARFAEMCVRNGIFKADDPIVRKMIPPSGEMPK